MRQSLLAQLPISVPSQSRACARTYSSSVSYCSGSSSGLCSWPGIWTYFTRQPFRNSSGVSSDSPMTLSSSNGSPNSCAAYSASSWPGLAALAQRGRRADAAELPWRGLHPLLHAPDQASQVGALRAVEGVQLIHHQVAQRLRFVHPPEPAVARPDQQVVEHLVVGEQDVRRRGPHAFRSVIRFSVITGEGFRSSPPR